MNTQLLGLHARMDDLGLGFMAAGLESFLESQARSEQSLVQTLNDLLDLELSPRRERAAKSRLMVALAHKACLTGYTAWYTSCSDLMENLSRAREAGRLKRKLVWLRKPHVLVIDEVGYESLNREQANLFFQVVNARYENGPILITTNKSFGSWSEMMADEAIATATLDRLLHHAHILSLKGDSYRMKDRLKTGVVDPD